MTEKRQTRLTNEERRVAKLQELIDDQGQNTPAWVIQDFEIITNKLSDARRDDPGTEDRVHVLTSAVAAFTDRLARTGLLVTSGSAKGRRSPARPGVTPPQLGADWIATAREILADQDRPLPRGAKAKIAREIASQFGGDAETIRKTLERANVYKD